MNNFNGLKFEKGKLQFTDGRKLMTATKKGKFTRDAIRDELIKMSDGLKEAGKIGQIGCAFHYQQSNQYVPAKMSAFGNWSLYDPGDSDRGQAYMNDSINEVQFYVINANDDKTKYIKPRKQMEEENMFLQRKKHA